MLDHGNYYPLSLPLLATCLANVYLLTDK